MSNWEILSQFTTKKGVELVICNLKEQVSNLGVTEYLACPLCSTPELTRGYSTKRRNKLNTDGFIGYCYRCDRTFLNAREDIDENQEFELPKFNLNLRLESGILHSDELDLFNSFSDLNEEGMSYIKSRNPLITNELIESLKIKSIKNGIVFPFYDMGELLFYVIRYIDSGIRFYMPSINHKPPYILGRGKKIVLVEGIFSAIACLFLYPGYVPIAVLGSKLTQFQLDFLKARFNPEEILVYLDVTKKSINTMEFIKLNWSGIYDIDIVESDGTDPDERLNKLLVEYERTK